MANRWTSSTTPASAMPELPAETAVVMHDAGAANQILAWIDAGLVPGGRVYAEGPAAALWAGRARPMLRPSLADAMEGADTLLSGTGWASDLEHRARANARMLGLPSHAVLDHWVNYPGRFLRDGETVLPDGLWVSNAEAAEIARRDLPGLPVCQLPDLYLQSQVAGIREEEGHRKPEGALLVLEPARSDWGRTRPGEFQALDYLLAHLPEAGIAPGTALRLRPHPSEPMGKYDGWVAANSRYQAQLDPHSGLAAAIGGATIVLGLNSYALTVALAAGRRVVSILPPWAPPCVLPHAGIHHLRLMAGNA